MGEKYLARYAEPEARALADICPGDTFQQVVVIPAYREGAALGEVLLKAAETIPGLLVILVVNRPDSEPNASVNAELHGWLASLGVLARWPQANSALLELASGSSLLWVERDTALPHKQGVGLARKIGCDLALAWIRAGVITSRWIHSSDADAELPAARFSEADCCASDIVAISFPFRHSAVSRDALAMNLYELKLHYYVLGLRAACSPYSFHTLGSCLACTAQSYARVRGIPRRAGAEDFYMLNKLAKLGPVSSPPQPVVELAGRRSDRVPFGTGPALSKLADSDTPLDEALFYHPRSFRALGCLLAGIADLYAVDAAAEVLADYPGAAQVLMELGLPDALQHCRQHSQSESTFRRHFDQWFDGFRTLKFIHGLRECGYEDLSLAASLVHPDNIWPTHTDDELPGQLLKLCRNELGWLQ